MKKIYVIQQIEKKRKDEIGEYFNISLKNIENPSDFLIARAFQRNRNAIVFKYIQENLNAGDHVKAGLETIKKHSNSAFYQIINIEKLEMIKPVVDSQIFRCMNELIDSTKREIIIGTPWIGDVGYLIEKLKKNAENGISVKILVRPVEQKDNSSDYKKNLIEDLKNSGCEVYLDKRIHFKIFLVDSIILVSSANLTPTAMLRNYESGILTRESRTVETFKNYLNCKINGATPLLEV